MNYTKNHHLPQWVASDRVRMDDFNAAMQNIESGISSAQTDASAARSAANAAQAAADEAKAAVTASLPFAVGSYTGTGKNLIIDLGFKPSFVIVSGMAESSVENDYESFIRYFAMTRDTDNIRRRLQPLSHGFVVYPEGNYETRYPNLNEPDRHYDYIAFK